MVIAAPLAQMNPSPACWCALDLMRTCDLVNSVWVLQVVERAIVESAEPRIQAVVGQQRRVGAAFHYCTVLKHKNAVGVAHGGESVSDDDGGAPAQQHGQRALDLNLVDELSTSDEYIANACGDADVFEVKYVERKPLPERLGIVAQEAADTLLLRWWERGTGSRYFS